MDEGHDSFKFGLQPVRNIHLDSRFGETAGLSNFLLISIANLIAWPVVYFLMRKVLRNYPYRIDIAFHYFLLAGVASVLIAVMTILYLSVRAALQNPVDSLRYE